jgi:hypothetical protein
VLNDGSTGLLLQEIQPNKVVNRKQHGTERERAKFGDWSIKMNKHIKCRLIRSRATILKSATIPMYYIRPVLFTMHRGLTSS